MVVVVVDVVLVVDVDTVVEAVTSGVHSCVPAVSMLPVIWIVGEEATHDSCTAQAELKAPGPVLVM